MSSRRAKAGRPQRTQLPSSLPASARIAWAYLASLGAVVVSAGTVVLANSSLATILCRSEGGDAVADCRLGWAVVSGLVGLALGWLVLGLLVHLGWRFVIAAISFSALLVSLDQLEAWWWWLLAAFVPVAAALSSHTWGTTPRARLARDAVLALLTVLAAVALTRWWLT